MVTVRAGSGRDGLPRPFPQPTSVMLEIQYGKVVISIVLMSFLRRLRGSEQIRGRAIVKAGSESRSRHRECESSRANGVVFLFFIRSNSYLDVSFNFSRLL